MDSERQREIASQGGRASHGNGHEAGSRKSDEAGAHHHNKAAFHHDTAAHHHRQAGQHRASGRHQEADLHAEAARGHEEDARHHGNEAQRHGRGFAGMDPDRQREIASEGGRASHGGRSQSADRSDEGSYGGDRPRNERGEFESRGSESRGSQGSGAETRGDYDDDRARRGSGRREFES